MSLKQKTISGLFWSFTDNFAKSGITFIIGILLARLLTPRDFGLIGMTTVFIAISQSFIDSGFTQALIRKQNCSQADYSTVFYFNLLISFVFYGLLILSSSLISQFFGEPTLEPIIQVLGLGLIFNALMIVQRAQLTKAINFKLQTVISVIAALTSGLVGVSMAFAGFGVWSLVATTLSGSFMTMLFLWFLNGWRPSLVFSRTSFSEMFSFGSRLLVSGLLDTLYRNIYLLVIGRFFTAEVLGFYTRAEGFQRLPAQNLTTVIQRVSYPVLSTLQEDIPRLRSAYRRLIQNTMLIAFVLMLGLAATAEPVIITLVGEQWQQSIVYLQLLCFVGVLYPLQAINLNMLKVQGRSDLFLRLEILKKLVAIPTIVIGIFFGIEAMLVGMIVNSLIAYYLNSYWSGQFIGYSMADQIRDILPSFALAASMSVMVYATGQFLAVSYPIQLIIQLVLGALLVFVLAEITRLDSYRDIKTIVLGTLRKKAVAL